jgi:hypothetical protein
LTFVLLLIFNTKNAIFAGFIPRQSLLRGKQESYFMYYPSLCQEFIAHN